MSSTETPAEVPVGAMIDGSIIKLSDGRSVFLGQADGIFMVGFTNGERRTQLAISGEALDALVYLALARRGFVVA